MAWIYLAGSEVCPLLCENGSDLCSTVRSTLIVKPCCLIDSLTIYYQEHPSGTISPTYAGAEIRETPTSSMGGSHARISALQDAERAWQASEADYFTRSFVYFGKQDQDFCSWKTFQQSQGAEELTSLEKLPRWGMTVDGALYPLNRLERNIKERDGFFWPTPKARDAKAAGMQSEQRRDNPSLPCRVWMITGRKINLCWLEWLMLYPIGWTELEPWAMQWFRDKRKKHSKS